MTDPVQARQEDASTSAEDAAALLDAVRGLTREVRTLRDRLDTLYAPREEVKRESRRRAWRFLASAVALVIVAQMMTMMTISYCFLNASNQQSHFCHLMPGYGQVVEQNSVRLSRFEKILDSIDQTNKTAIENQQKVADIDRRLKKLEEAK
jgi:hypothetical protein